jgi:hypothetical protein
METDPTKSLPGDLPAQWRQRAQFLSDYGDPHVGRLWVTAAAELDEALKVLGEETLTLVEAAKLCGYTADHLGSLVRKGKIPNAGRSDAPRIRHGDLPRKSPASPGRPVTRRRKGAETNITSIRAKLSSRGKQ